MFPYSLNFNSRLVFHLNLIWTLGLQFLSVVGDAMGWCRTPESRPHFYIIEFLKLFSLYS